MEIAFSQNETYQFYLIIYIFSIFLLGISEKMRSKKGINILFFMVSFFLYIVVAHRTVGIDRDTYVEMFGYTNFYRRNYSFIVMEPLYFLLNIVVYYFLGDIFFIQMFQGAIYAISMFKVLSFCRSKNCNTVIVYSFCISTVFFYMMGLNRMCIAIGIFTIAFINYLQKQNSIRFIISLIVCSLFHYSAVLILCLAIFLFVIKHNKKINNLVIYLGYVVPIFLFVLLKIFQDMLANKFLSTKYSIYVEVGFSVSNIISVIYVLPLIVAYFFIGFKRKNVFEEILLEKQMAISILTFHLSCFFVGAFRFNFYMNYFVAYMYAMLFNRFKFTPRFGKFIFEALFVLLITIYSIVVFFDSPYITEKIVPLILEF
ncbi:MAG: EpsG family protein [Lachnospiraceae bacterium]|jgi:hypothetical protein|nr:EpsG family protein [Lachnospiraceae bacterium]